MTENSLKDKPSPSFEKVFEGILASQAFDLVETFSNEELWETLLSQEKDLLSQLFTIHGEQLLEANNSLLNRNKALSAFRSATKLTPLKAHVWFRLGGALLLGDDSKELDEAEVVLQKSLQLDDGFFDAWYALANLQVRQALQQENQERLVTALQLFEKASCVFERTTTTTDVTCPKQFYWHWGLSWFLLGRGTGEPIELQHAITLYKKAFNLGLENPDFFNDFANVMLEFGMLTGQQELLNIAIEFYERGIVLDDIAVTSALSSSAHNKAVRLFNLACCYQFQFEGAYELQLYVKTTKLFEQVSQLNPNFSPLWFKWGQVEMINSRFYQDIDLLESALDKFKRAEALGINLPALQAYMGEAEAIIGSFYERAELLQSAYHRVTQAMVESPDQLEVWYACAIVHVELWRYFQEPVYLEKARSLTEKGLVQFPKSSILWHLFGTIKGALGEQLSSLKLLQEALLCFHLAGHSYLKRFGSFWNDWGVLLLQLADAYQDERLAFEALEKFESAIQTVDEPDPQWIFNCGWACEVIGELTDSVDWCERALSCFEAAFEEDNELIHIRLQQALLLIRIAELTKRDDPIDLAVRYLEEYLATDMEDEIALEDLAFCYIKLAPQSSEFLFKAEECCKGAIALGNPRACYLLACCYAQMGNWPDAFDELQSAYLAGLLPSSQELEEEVWLEPLREHLLFQELLDEVRFIERQMARGEMAQELET